MNGERNIRFTGRQREAPAVFGSALEDLLHVRWQIRRLAGNHVPAIGGVDVNVHHAELAAEMLSIENEAGRPEASGYGRFLKNADLDVGDAERFTLDGR